ncbi:MAG TPA: thiamine diphosphokinase [Deltaproteobacteria bacterium]|jgi:thiamine pyrophosphokinase|nr:thiamine diphosphokinase [Deltaproteobacteria bacterium]HQI00577.1 thiamine diphosphokinase [Deltaproteobacteria bacterium]HQJ08219.1 thiamine diphosphokinase [Deltaproteobacteria bacterium]
MFLIVSGGDAPDSVFLKARAAKARMVIAADKGAEYCLRAGVRPDLVVGDMDSLPLDILEEVKKAGIPFQRYDTCKDETDTRLALLAALEGGARSIEMIAATGDRIDHTLANIHLLYAALLRGVDACILTPDSRIFLVDACSTISGSKGALVSLLPLTAVVRGISLSGFRWDIEEASMEIGNPYGISNKVCSDEARIQVREGTLVAVIYSPAFQD